MIANGSDVKFKSLNDLKTPLHVACELGLSNAAKILLKYGANAYVKDSSNKTPIEYALLHNQMEVYKLINALEK